MKKKSNLKIVNTQTKAQADEEWFNKGKAVREERSKESDRLSLTDGQRRLVLNAFLDRVEQTVFELAFQFASGVVGNSGNWTEGPETPEFIEQLHPWMKPHEARIDAALLKADVQGDPATQDLQEEFDSVKCTREETGFKLGILMGARLAGFPPEKVKKMAEYLVDTLR